MGDTEGSSEQDDVSFLRTVSFPDTANLHSSTNWFLHVNVCTIFDQPISFITICNYPLIIEWIGLKETILVIECWNHTLSHYYLETLMSYKYIYKRIRLIRKHSWLQKRLGRFESVLVRSQENLTQQLVVD